MRLHEPNITSFKGDPLTGVVPPQLIVYGNDGRLTPQQFGEVAHAYKLFRDALRTSMGDYLTQHRTLADGTRIRMTSNSGLDYVYVWPTGGGTILYVFRGFVLAPKPVDVATLAEALDKDILAFVDDTNKWDKFMAPYPIGTKREALPYTVTDIAWEGGPAHVSKPGYTVWANKSIRGVHPVGDAKFNDVYAAHGSSLYHDGVKVRSFGVGTSGLPVVAVDSGAYKVTFVGDDNVSGVAATDPPTFVHAYRWTDYFAPITSGIMFSPGVDLIEGTPVKASFLGYNKVSTGAVQIWNATATLAQDDPFLASVAEVFTQLDIPAALNSDDGGTTITIAPITRPIANPDALISDFGYAGIGPVCTGPIMSGPTSTGGSATKRTLNVSYSDPLAFSINDAQQVTIARTVNVFTEATVSSSTIHGSWGESEKLWGYPNSPDVVYGRFPASFGSGDLYPGDPYGLVQTADIILVTHTDDSTCSVDVPGAPQRIWDVTVEHAFDEDSEGINEYPPDNPPSIGQQLNPSNPGTKPSTYTVVPSWPRRTEGRSVNTSLETHTIAGTARDYFYFDRTNEVFGWIETEIASSSSKVDDNPVTGSSSVRVTLRFTGRGANYTRDLYNESFGIPFVLTTTAPWAWLTGAQYHQPPRPAPIFSPTWQEQGMCPYIAYTTSSEPVQRIAMFFRLQCLKTDVPADYEPTLFPDTTEFKAYMFEQLIGFYAGALGAGGATTLAEIFTAVLGAPIVLHYTDPADLFDNIFNPLDEATQYANLYRT
jgi:hypothetical protein